MRATMKPNDDPHASTATMRVGTGFVKPADALRKLVPTTSATIAIAR